MPETILDEDGRVVGPVSAHQLNRWKVEASLKSSDDRKIRALISLGEYSLAALEAPSVAYGYLVAAQRLANPISAEHGLATYDLALLEARRGNYKTSAKSFTALLSGRATRGTFSASCTRFWLRRLERRIGYRESLSKMGIPQGVGADPMCGVKSLRASLSSIGMPYSLRRIRAAAQVRGLGSSIYQLSAGAGKLGARSRIVSLTDVALKVLPKPIVAFVERDHFVSITRADDSGISYACSACCGQASGPRQLSWAQWHAMEAGPFLLVSRKGSLLDRGIHDALATAKIGNSGWSRLLASRSQAGRFGALNRLRGQITAVVGYYPMTAWTCGGWSNQFRSEPWNDAPEDGDPVNLATGEEVHRSDIDLAIYNPNGPSISWSRTYQSFANDKGDQNANHRGDFGPLWTHPYNVLVHDTNLAHIPQVPYGSTTTILALRQDNIDAYTWEIQKDGVSVANSSSANGWSVPYLNYASINIVPPASAPVGAYRVRWKAFSSPTWYRNNADFDVVNANTVCQDDKARISVTSTASDSGLKWLILKGGSTVATSDAAGGWNVSYVSPTAFDVTAPYGAVTGTGYEFKWLNTSTGVRYTGQFEVLPAHLVLSSGTKSLVMPNGAKAAFSAPSVPTASNPTVVCSVASGTPFYIEWLYSAGNPYGTYRVLQPDGSYFTMAPIAWVPSSSTRWAIYHVGSITDKNGNSILFNYVPSTNSAAYPVLSTIVDATSGTALLTLERTATSSMISKAYDCYGRSVRYAYSSGNLSSASQVVATTATSAPTRVSYGYTTIKLTPMMTTVTEPSPTGSGTSTLTFAYNATTGFVTSQTDPNGNRRRYVEVDQSHTKVIVEDSLGNLVNSYTVGFDGAMHETTRTDGTNSTVVTTCAYGDLDYPGKPSTITDGTGRVWSYDYDRYGHVLSVTSPRGITSTNTYSYSAFPLGRLTSNQMTGRPAKSFTYFEPSGNIATVTTQSPIGNSITVSYTYTSKGNLQSVTTPGPVGGTSITTTYGYTNDGTYSQTEWLGKPIVATDGAGKKTHYRYDQTGAPTVTTDSLGNSVTATYNLAGQVASVIYPPTGQTGSGQTTVTNGYLYPGGPRTQTWTYDEGGAAVRGIGFSYGPAQELLGVFGDVQPVSYTYDADYRIKTRTDALNRVTTYSYSPAGNIASVTYPDGSASLYTSYDATGKLLQSVDPAGHATNFTYGDPDGLVTAETHPDDSSLSRILSYDSLGRLSHVSNSVESVDYAYGAVDEILSRVTTYAGLSNSVTLSYTYNQDFTRHTLTTPVGAFTYAYDSLGRLSSITNPYGESTSQQFLDNGAVWKRTLGNGAVTTYSYDPMGRATGIVNANAAGTILSSFGSIQYSALGQVKSVTSSYSGVPAYDGTSQYTYDSKGRLTVETSTCLGGFTNTFGYDSAGNPTSFRGSTKSYSLLDQISGTGFIYNGTGSPTQYNGQSLTFDEKGHLTSRAGESAGYGVSGQRAWRETASGKTYYLYDGGYPVLELTSTNGIVAVNTFGIIGLDSRTTAGGSTFYVFDQRGGTAQRLTSSGSVASAHTQDAFGLPTSTVTTNDPYQGFGAQFGYRSDTQGGLLLLGNRYFDPATGRFLTRDPIGSAGGINLYAYCENDPVNFIDPSGLEATTQQMFGAAIKQNAETAKDFYRDKLGNIPGGWVGAGAINTGIDAVSGIGSGILCAGTAMGRFAGDPSWENLPGAVIDGASLMLPMLEEARAAEGAGNAARGSGGDGGGGGGGGGGSRRGNSCFVAGTDVLLADGTSKHIENVETGDRVVTRNSERGPSEASSVGLVTRTFKRVHQGLVVLKFDDGATVRATEDHPFYVRGKGFTRAQDLQVGDRISTRDARSDRVRFVSRDASTVKVYNLEILGDHTYFVRAGKKWLWVHNTCEPKLPATPGEVMKGFDLKPSQKNFDSSIVLRYAKDMLKGDIFPPITYYEGRIVEGHHRILAAKIAGKDIDRTEAGGPPRGALEWSDTGFY